MNDHDLPGSESLIETLGINHLSDEEQEKTLAKAVDILQKRVLIRLLDKMDEAAAAEAKERAKDPEGLLIFLAEKYPELPDVIQEETERLKFEFTGNF